jgi:hypothetical protein
MQSRIHNRRIEMKTTTNLTALNRSLVTLAALRLADKSTEKNDEKYAAIVAEVAKRTKKTPQHVRTYARRAARRAKMN